MLKDIKFRVRDGKSGAVIGYECLINDIENKSQQWASSTNGRDWANGVFTAELLKREMFTGLKIDGEVDVYQHDRVLFKCNGCEKKHEGKVVWIEELGCLGIDVDGVTSPLMVPVDENDPHKGIGMLPIVGLA